MDYCFLKSVDYEIFLEIVDIDAAIGKRFRKTHPHTSKKHGNRQAESGGQFSHKESLT
tara:strand:+ start:546 stop:719 length:174 start_codon:yes stop_codon:yes gene_type:complete